MYKGKRAPERGDTAYVCGIPPHGRDILDTFINVQKAECSNGVLGHAFQRYRPWYPPKPVRNHKFGNVLQVLVLYQARPTNKLMRGLNAAKSAAQLNE